MHMHTRWQQCRLGMRVTTCARASREHAMKKESIGVRLSTGLLCLGKLSPGLRCHTM